uniref:Cation efflux protein cytoplasmic domain-containing protein n=1 Tax=Polytomella parva TaxID=51329 RepID=A0A7S0YIJ4_9CHLO|mmetsp:Transcript_28575/g.52561  ORF Transcript_28575/g.52561 Transcript_28575/m.52561 type:complete len:385 (+) Transcript_28575:39-1193(+)|eukprot:CAMPEP_0175064614 /NCGR_PEP_ID=MMETSP0052_2-20121109/15437_1 /TAXON_ID=51329 ORGANISM="Polytomella parva, Strain SAG 63-3" /NCGR_SAMPLE_ID=MMETSP0052_2 /ASSEMBLY_ACC=CAM_ASM_000194 /LENGTH=384 /DNA_ID=CAMNT_0016330997 /DNA_START=34 /DNA_END=1188 /DNA_ORIENTATION=-
MQSEAVETKEPRLRQAHRANFSQFKVSDNDLQVLLRRKKKGKRVVDFYQRQNETIDSFAEVDELNKSEGDEEDQVESPTTNLLSNGSEMTDQEKADKRMVNLSFASNIVLLAIRVSIAAVSGSLSLVVTTMDAILDVISGFIILYTLYVARKQNKYKYPIGQSRMEPLGIIVFSSIMGTMGFSICVEGAMRLMNGHSVEMDHLWAVIAGAVAVIVMKGALYFVCRNSSSSSVQAFAMDHLNDVIVNVAGLTGALLGSFVWWALDPIVGIIIAVLLVLIWGKQAMEHVRNLVGVSASPEYLQKLTYLALHHDPAIRQLDTVRAYSIGDRWLVEMDIVLDAEMPLKDAHTVGESLQIKLEKLPEVARAFVHLDVDSTHAPEHKIIS